MAVTKKFAGAKVYIGTNSASLASESSWTQLPKVTAMTGTLGGKWKTADTSLLADLDDTASKTTRTPGSCVLTFNDDPADSGQVAIIAAAADQSSDKPYNFKIELNDDAVSAGNNPTTIKFSAHVLGTTLNTAQRQSVMQRSADLMLQVEPTVTAAAA